MITNFNNFINENKKNYILVGDYKMPISWYNEFFDEFFGDEEELRKYLEILDKYYKEGGKIQRIIFSYTRPNLKRLGDSWTHINNDWKNYLQTIFDFNMEEGRINGDEGIYLLIGETAPNNIAIRSSLEQYQNNPEEQELTILDTSKIKNKLKK